MAREMNALSAEPRDLGGKGAARANRRNGKVPAVIYGGKKPPEAISIAQRDLEKAWKAGGFLTQLLELEVGGTKTRTIPRDVQVHPVSDQPLHVDFLRLEAGARLKLSIPVRFDNEAESPGIKRGGVLNIVRHEVELDCPVENIPEQLVADLDGTEIGDSIHISQIALPDGVVPTITDRDFTVATIAAPSRLVTEAEEAAAAEGEEGAEEAATEAEGGEAPAAEGESEDS